LPYEHTVQAVVLSITGRPSSRKTILESVVARRVARRVRCFLNCPPDCQQV